MNLTEIFNSSIDLSWSQSSPGVTVAKFEVDDKQYECFIEVGTYTFEEKDLKFLNVGFSREQDGKKIFDVTLDTKDAIKVLGAVINGLVKKIDNYHADAVMMSATDNVSQRMKIYKWIARRFKTKFGIWIESIKTPSGEVTLLISSKLDKNLINQFEKFIKTKNIEKTSHR